MGKNLHRKNFTFKEQGIQNLLKKKSFQKFSQKPKKVVFLLLGDCPGQDQVVSLQKNYFGRVSVFKNYHEIKKETNP
jgi:hypothetical protein